MANWKGLGEIGRVHLAGLEPATFGSVDGSADAARPDTPITSGDEPASVARQLPEPAENAPADADLARLAAAWPQLPPHIKAAVLALVATARAIE
jgi:hypothetical protein